MLGVKTLAVSSTDHQNYRISISLIYMLAKRTGLVRYDPILWFSLMMMPAGPPALVISGFAELAKISEAEKMAVAKTLTVRNFCISKETENAK